MRVDCSVNGTGGCNREGLWPRFPAVAALALAENRRQYGAAFGPSLEKRMTDIGYTIAHLPGDPNARFTGGDPENLMDSLDARIDRVLQRLPLP